MQVTAEIPSPLSRRDAFVLFVSTQVSRLAMPRVYEPATGCFRSATEDEWAAAVVSRADKLLKAADASDAGEATSRKGPP